MAGSHPDLTAPRIEYDRDGTRMYRSDGSTITEVLAADIRNINDEDVDSPTLAGDRIILVFPFRYDVEGIFFAEDQDAEPWTLQWSNNSTTGLDGTWTSSATGVTNQFGFEVARQRSDIQSLSDVDNVQMIRLVKPAGGTTTVDARVLHLYGRATTGQTLHRLRFWHPTLDQPLDDFPAHLDWGNAQQSTSADKQVRVKNGSPSLTASGVKVFLDALTEPTPTMVGQHQLSTDGSTFVAASDPGVSLSNLAPGAISPVITIRRNISGSAQLGLWRQRLVASAASWA